MRNTLSLPIIAILLAIALAILVMATRADDQGPLTELELGAIAWTIALGVYGLQGLISVLLEGRELRPGRMLPRLTGPLSALTVIGSIVLLGIAVALAIGLVGDWRTGVLGTVAGAGCLVLVVLLISYKEAFLGDEASFDNRDDGVPW